LIYRILFCQILFCHAAGLTRGGACGPTQQAIAGAKKPR